MTRILHLSTSPRASRSLSRALGAELLERLKAQYPDSTVTIRDLSGQPLHHVDGATVAAMFTPPDRDYALCKPTVESVKLDACQTQKSMPQERTFGPRSPNERFNSVNGLAGPSSHAISCLP